MQFSQMVLLNVEIILLPDNIPAVIITGTILPLLHRQLIQVLPITQIMLHMFSRHGHFIPVVQILLAPFNELEPKTYQKQEVERHSLWFLLMVPRVVSQVDFQTTGSASNIQTLNSWD